MTSKTGLCPHIPLGQSFLRRRLMCNESVGEQTSSCDDLPARTPFFQVGLNLMMSDFKERPPTLEGRGARV